MISSFYRCVALAMALFVSSAAATYDNVLKTGEQLYSDPHKGPTALVYKSYEFGLYENGDLYIKGDCGKKVIAHGGSKHTVVKMQTDGNLVLYNLENIKHPVAKWSSGTSGYHEADLVLYENTVIIAVNGKVIWKYTLECKKDIKDPPPPPRKEEECKEYVCKGNRLKTHEKLKKGEYLCADGMKFGLTCKGKWIYKEHDKVKVYGAISDSKNYADISMQSDGNLVLYELDGHKITDQCSTQTAGYHEVTLYLTHDGPQLVQGHKIIWDTYPVHCRH